MGNEVYCEGWVDGWIGLRDWRWLEGDTCWPQSGILSTTQHTIRLHQEHIWLLCNAVSICCKLLLINPLFFILLLVQWLFWHFHCLCHAQALTTRLCLIQARTPAINIQSNIHRAKKGRQEHNYTSFSILVEVKKEEGSTHKSLILAQRLVGEIKQRQIASLCWDVSADKDLPMPHFHGA